MGKFTKDKRVSKNTQYSSYDVYYRKAKEQCYRARSAYKLLQIDDIYHIFDKVQRVVDLCGAPGSWSQVCRKKLGEKGYFNPQNSDTKPQGQRIVSVDLQETAPIDNVFHIVGDITRQQTLSKIVKAFGEGQLCDLVISDGAPDITGFHDMDQYIQSQLLVAALNIACKLLKNKGNFVAKIFKGSQIGYLYSQFKPYFREIHIVKPSSSRQSSVENFIVGIDFQRNRLQKDNILNIQLSTFFSEVNKVPKKNPKEQQITEVQNIDRQQQAKRIFGFVTCGDLSAFDCQLQFLAEE